MVTLVVESYWKCFGSEQKNVQKQATAASKHPAQSLGCQVRTYSVNMYCTTTMMYAYSRHISARVLDLLVESALAAATQGQPPLPGQGPAATQ